MTAEPLIRLPPALSRPQHRADARFVLGVDGGATKTLAAVLEVQTGRLHMAHGGSSNEDTGGWGHLLGDEGSGYWLGIQSIRAALRERDGSGPATALTAAAVSFFGARSVEAVADLVYAKPLSKAEIAAFSVETARVANQGDEVARELYTRAGAELGSQILVVVRHTGLGGEDSVGGAEPAPARKTAAQGEEAAQDEDPDEGELAAPHGEFPVGLIGSAFKAGSAFVDPLAATVRASAPHARISVVHMAPVGGSLLLAA